MKRGIINILVLIILLLLLAGEPLVREMLKRAFKGNEEICSQFYICAWMGRESGNIGKNNHIARLWEKIIGKETNEEILDEESFLPYHDTGEDYWPNMKIDPPQDESYYFKRTMLVDDDENNLCIWNKYLLYIQ